MSWHGGEGDQTMQAMNSEFDDESIKNPSENSKLLKTIEESNDLDVHLDDG